MIERWIEVLSDESIDLSAAEIADACLLAVIQHRFGVDQPSQQDIVSETGAESAPDTLIAPLSDEIELPDVPDRVPEEVPPKTSGNIFTEPTQHEAFPDAKPIQVPTAPALRDLLPFARALRPLMQQRPVAFQGTQLDEKATVQKIAEERVLWPVSQPLTEGWLELAIVVDESDSMLLWRQTIQELTRFFKHYGVFRDVRLWGLVTKERAFSRVSRQGELQLENVQSQKEADADEIYIRANPFTKGRSQDLRHPKSLLDPSRRRLILLVTDCVDDIWQTPQLLSTMQLWAKRSPMAMVQMMPEWLWSRTQLSQARRVWFQGKTEGSVNQDLIAVRSVLNKRPLTRSSHQDIKLPILTIESQSWQTWALMLADRGSHYAPGFLFSPQAQLATIAVQQRRHQQRPADVSAKIKAKTFRGGASSIARRLASLLAASPSITLPVVRMVQDTLLPQSKQVHVAEVLLGDILKPTEALTVDVNPDQVSYEFVDPKIRSLLLAEAPVTDTTGVLSKYIRRNLDKSLEEFVAYWQAGNFEDFSEEQIKPIATVAAEVLQLQYRGPEYVEFVQAVRDRYDTHPNDQSPLPEEVSPEDFPALSDFEFDRILFEESRNFPPPLLTENFTVFTLERKTRLEAQTGQSSEPFNITVTTLVEVEGTCQVRREQKQSRRFVESLPKEQTLEMMAIPGGSFMMGSLEDDDKHRVDELPQHEVRIEPFLMSRYPITQEQWRVVAALPRVNRVLQPSPSYYKGAMRPVERVSWDDAVEFCARLSVHTGRKYRLPTESEWEYACRAETTTAFHFGNIVSTKVANYNGRYLGREEGENRRCTTPVTYFDGANAFGLSDMHGNVYEWCLDHWHDNYENAPNNGNAWFTGGESSRRPIRGGSWTTDPNSCRSAYRYPRSFSRRDNDIGFRVSCAVSKALQ